MSDVPQRANAAQLAARNIKMKPQRKKPLTAPAGASQQQSFAPPTQNGMLFGGGQASSDFSFSAGGPAISFTVTPQYSTSGNGFGSNASESESDDPRAGNNEEELKRRNRIPQFMDKEDDDEVPMFAPMPDDIAQNGISMFNTNTPQSSSSFTFGQNSAPSSMFNPPQNAQTPQSFTFGSSSTQSAAPASNPFAPTSNGFGSTPAQSAAPQTNIFGGFGNPATPPAQSAALPTNPGFPSFGQQPSSAQPAASTPSFSFGASAPAPATTAAKPSFSFGQTSTSSAQPTSTFSFGSTNTSTATTSAAPANNLFGGSQGQQSSNNLFGSAGTAKEASPSPAVTNNLFGGSQGQQSSNLFGSTSTPKEASPSPAPANNLFGGSQAQQSSNLFGSTNPPKESSPSLFGNSAPAAPASTSMFGSNSQSSAPEAPVMFGSHQVTAPQTSNSFGNASPQPASTSNLFGTGSTAPPPVTSSNTNNLFGASNPVATPSSTASTLFGQQTQQVESTSNLFGGTQESTPSNGLFGHLNQPLSQQTQNGSNLFSNPNPTSDLNYNSPQNAAPVSQYSNSNYLPHSSELARSSDESELAKWHKLANDAAQYNEFLKQNQSGKTMFDCLAQVPQRSEPRAIPINTSPKPAHSTRLPKLSDLVPQFRNPSDSTRKRKLSSEYSPPKLPHPHIKRLKFDHGWPKWANQSSKLDNADRSILPPWAFQDFSVWPLEDRHDGYYAKINANLPAKLMNMQSLPPMKPVDAPATANQPPPTGMFPSLSPSKTQQAPKTNSTNEIRQSTNSSNSVIQSIEPKEVADNLATANPTSALDITDQYIDRFMPKGYTPSQKAQFYSCYRMRALNKAMEKLFARMPIGMEISDIVDYYNEQREQIMSQSGRPFKSSKRKAAGEQESSSSKRVRQGEPVSRPQLGGASEASPAKASGPKSSQSPFKAQSLAAPQPAAPSSSPSKNQLLPNGSITPKAPTPSFGNPPASASPSKGKRKAEYQISDRDPEGKGAERAIKTPKLNGSVGSETSNIFKNILDSSSKTPKSPEKSNGRLENLEKASQEAPRNNPFASLATPASAKPAFQPQLGASSLNSSAQKTAPTPSKPAATPIKPPTFGAKPPTFGTGPVNFLAQFGQQAKKDEKDNEEKLMEKAKEEDMDSDDDEAEWEANYKKKRQAELKELEDLAKSKRASFVVGQGFTFGDASKTSSPAASADASRSKPIFSSSTTAPAAPKPLFGQTPTPASSESIFSSVNGSRSSTPGGSVLDSHTPGKSVSFSGNIFGHLSNPGSPANGTNDDDSDADGESDSENKDPTYQPAGPGSETGSGPTTPVEKTGTGIASAKKMASTTPFSFGSTAQPSKPLFGQNTTTSSGLFGATATSSSGTSSPGGSLFDRISKDSNGNPIRQVPSEEKENTQPNTTNIFGTSNASPSNASQSTPPKPLFGQTDKTWKPDSPIRFGSTTPNGASATAPSVSVTDATPTKPNLFAGLFGNSTSKPASPVSGSLFGNSTTPKAAPSTAAGVGFAFGGPSSTTSSLFPSAAVSASTSRATSPGQTTDGDSAAEGSNDPDAEKHEQIDLTKGGPGEEDEELLHEVRAKALKYSPSDDGEKSPWVTKGLGPLRILKHKETKAARVLLRADPSGTIVLNKGILAGVDFTANGKTLKFLAASDGGSGLETWMLQVKTPEFAAELAKVLEANKAA